jgi:hypothetical protein
MMAVRTSLHGKARITKQVKKLATILKREEKAAIRSWEPSLTRAFQTFGNKIADRFRQVKKRRMLTKADEIPDEDIATEALAIAWAEGDISVIANSYAGQYLHVSKMTFDALDTTMNLGVNMSDYMQSAILKTSGRRLGLLDLEQTTKDAMFEALEQARAEGLGADAMARIIAEKVSAGPWLTARTRAEIIARTETKYAQNWSSLEAYRQGENVTDVLVFDALLGPTDEECEAINGQTVGMEEAMALMESEHPNGTRSFAPVVN